MEIHGKLVDIHKKAIFPATITVERGIITRIERNSHRGKGFILPGFIDAHLQIESALLPPTEFARMAVRHGTIATVSDPKKMAAVAGMSGVEYMLLDGAKVPMKFFFGAPANLSLHEVRELLQRPQIKYLGQARELAKIQIAKELKKPIDGYAEGLFGEELKKYCAEGVSTDFSSTTLSEARERRAAGMKILVRERFLTALFPLLQEDPDHCMFCTEHLLPDSLILGHMNLLVKKAIQKGMDPMAAIACATKNPVEHYGLEVGLLRVGDPADFIIVEDLETFRVLETYIDGECVFMKAPLFSHLQPPPLNHFKASLKSPKDFAIKEKKRMLKMAKVHRQKDIAPQIEWVKNFGLKKGAIASSATSDPDHLIAFGLTDRDLCNAVNSVLQHKGGISLSYRGITDVLPLPIAGLLSNAPGEEVAHRYGDLDQIVRTFGTNLTLTVLLDHLCLLNSQSTIGNGGS